MNIAFNIGGAGSENQVIETALDSILSGHEQSIKMESALVTTCSIGMQTIPGHFFLMGHPKDP